MPESGGPLARRQRQGRPSVTTAEQHVSVGGMGLKGATAALHGISCTSAEKNVLLHPPTSSSGNIGGGGCRSSCCAVTMVMSSNAIASPTLIAFVIMEIVITMR